MTQTLTDVVGPSEESVPVPAAGPERIEGRTPLELAWRRIRRDKVSLISAVFIVFLVLVAVFAPLICRLIGQDPYSQDRGPQGLTLDGIPVGPSSKHWLGTDDVGRDVLARIIYGARISLEVGLAATAVAVVLGLLIGMLAGFYGGKTDTFLSRFMDVILSFPFVLTALSIVAITGPHLWVTILVISFFTWSSVGRIIRGQVLSLREREFIEAARSLGASNFRIMRVDILPNLVAPLLVYSTLLIPVNIVSEATLSFLGLGVPIPTATWGEMLSNASNVYTVAWWFLAFPSLALLMTTLAFNLLGDGLRDALDPRADRVLAK
ncbi:MAG: transporter permease [Frankiales bacterium]|nr:transporter permease [Frankiales bacterium]